MKTREWLSKDNTDTVLWPVWDEDKQELVPQQVERPRWGGLLTVHGNGEQVLELHKERRFALLKLNNRLLKEQNACPSSV